jgi:hypothetical protein
VALGRRPCLDAFGERQVLGRLVSQDLRVRRQRSAGVRKTKSSVMVARDCTAGAEAQCNK